MDAQTAAALANSVAHLNILYVITGLLVVVGAFVFLGALGEKVLGLNLRGFVDNVETQANLGNLWPGVICFVVTPAAIMGLVLWIGLR